MDAEERKHTHFKSKHRTVFADSSRRLHATWLEITGKTPFLCTCVKDKVKLLFEKYENMACVSNKALKGEETKGLDCRGAELASNRFHIPPFTVLDAPLHVCSPSAFLCLPPSPGRNICTVNPSLYSFYALPSLFLHWLIYGNLLMSYTVFCSERQRV